MTKNAKPMTHAEALTLIKSHPACETPDILTVLNPTSASFYDEKTHEFALSLGLDVAAILTNKQKQVKRATQMLNCIRGGLVTDLDYTHTRILLAMRAAGAFNLNTDAITSLAANKITPNVETRGVTRGQINHLFKMSHSIDTVKSKVSNSIGKNGYMNVLGIVERKGAKHAEIVFNPAHKFAQAFFKMIDSATDGQLQALAEKGEKLA